MSLYVQLFKTKGHFVTRENPPYAKVVEMDCFFVAKAILGKMELSNLSPKFLNILCNIQSEGHNVSPEIWWGIHQVVHRNSPII